MRAKTFLEIHKALLNKKPLLQCDDFTPKGLYNGLCSVWLNNQKLSDNDVFELFIPTITDKDEHDLGAYWAEHRYCGEFGVVYNDLRQNIILFCAAINGELLNPKP